MRFKNALYLYGAYWSTPFCKWQGSYSHLNAIPFAAQVASKVLADRKIDPKSLDGVVLGITVLQKSQLYGGPWIAAMIGAEGITGTMVSQACATGAGGGNGRRRSRSIAVAHGSLDHRRSLLQRAARLLSEPARPRRNR